jgi:hypothetical protein
MLVTVALLATYCAYAGWVAVQKESLLYGIAALLALVACVALAMLRPWSRFLVYILTVAFTGGWIYSAWQAARSGYFALVSTQASIVTLAPGVALVAVSSFCAVAVYRQFAQRRASS